MPLEGFRSDGVLENSLVLHHRSKDALYSFVQERQGKF